MIVGDEIKKNYIVGRKKLSLKMKFKKKNQL